MVNAEIHNGWSRLITIHDGWSRTIFVSDGWWWLLIMFNDNCWTCFALPIETKMTVAKICMYSACRNDLQLSRTFHQEPTSSFEGGLGLQPYTICLSSWWASCPSHPYICVDDCSTVLIAWPPARNMFVGALGLGPGAWNWESWQTVTNRDKSWRNWQTKIKFNNICRKIVPNRDAPWFCPNSTQNPQNRLVCDN